MRYQFSQADHSKGGKAVAKLPGGNCPKCEMHFKTHAQLAAHLGLHGFADRYADGDIQKARHLLSITGAAASDSTPWNGAYEEGHKMLRLFGKDRVHPIVNLEGDNHDTNI